MPDSDPYTLSFQDPDDIPMPPTPILHTISLPNLPDPETHSDIANELEDLNINPGPVPVRANYLELDLGSSPSTSYSSSISGCDSSICDCVSSDSQYDAADEWSVIYDSDVPDLTRGPTPCSSPSRPSTPADGPLEPLRFVALPTPPVTPMTPVAPRAPRSPPRRTPRTPATPYSRPFPAATTTTDPPVTPITPISPRTPRTPLTQATPPTTWPPSRSASGSTRTTPPTSTASSASTVSTSTSTDTSYGTFNNTPNGSPSRTANHIANVTANATVNTTPNGTTTGPGLARPAAATQRTGFLTLPAWYTNPASDPMLANRTRDEWGAELRTLRERRMRGMGRPPPTPVGYLTGYSGFGGGLGVGSQWNGGAAGLGPPVNGVSAPGLENWPGASGGPVGFGIGMRNGRVFGTRTVMINGNGAANPSANGAANGSTNGFHNASNPPSNPAYASGSRARTTSFPPAAVRPRLLHMRDRQIDQFRYELMVALSLAVVAAGEKVEDDVAEATASTAPAPNDQQPPQPPPPPSPPSEMV